MHVVPSAYDERPLAHMRPDELARHHAREKNRAALTSPGAQLVLAADTVVDVDGVAFGKPPDDAEARTMLRQLSGRTHVVHTAFTLRDLDTGIVHDELVSSAVTFRPLDATTIEEYAACGDGADKAGAYGIQGLGATLVERIDGDYFTVVGLPLAAFAAALPRLGRRLSYLPQAVVR